MADGEKPSRELAFYAEPVQAAEAPSRDLGRSGQRLAPDGGYILLDLPCGLGIVCLPDAAPFVGGGVNPIGGVRP